MCATAGDGVAADWKIKPTVQLRENYTDNLRLAPKGLEQSDWVTEVEPGVSVTARGARLQVSADYSFQYRLYANHSNENGHNHRLNSSGLLDVWDRKLFLQGSASITQQNLSPLGAQSVSNINLSGNRTEIRQTTLSPYWVSRLGNWGNLQARYLWNKAESDGRNQVLDTESQTVSLSLASGPAFNDLGWAVAYSKQSVDSTGGQFAKRELESMTGNVRYRVLPTLYGLVSIGTEDNTYGNTRGSTGGDFYSIGLEWAPSTRTKVKGTIGERYFGTTYSFDAEHRTRLTTWTMGYSEQIIITPGQFSLPVSVSTAATLDRLFLSQIPDTIERQQVVDAVIVQYGLPQNLNSSVDFLSNQVSLVKRFHGAFGLRGVRSTTLLNFFREDRSNESLGTTLAGTDPFSISNSVIQAGYTGVFSWRFSERTSASLSFGQTRSKYTDAAREDTTSTFRVGVSHQLQPKVRGGLDFRTNERESNAAGANFRENAIIGSLSLAF